MAARRTLVLALLSGMILGLFGALPAGAQEPSKPAVVRGNEWHLRASLDGGAATNVFTYGRPADVALMCDWNGDGTRTPGIVRERTDGRLEWHLRNSLSGGHAHQVFSYGRHDEIDTPICGDWNGDGVQTPGVVRPPAAPARTLRWLLRDANAAGVADRWFCFGRLVGDDILWVVVGDWNANGVDTPGVVFFRDRLEWHLRMVNRAGVADLVVRYGVGDRPPGGDSPIVGDWNGDGQDTVGVVRRPAAGALTWLLKNSLSGGAADIDFRYGLHEDAPLAWR
jgi:hypothetical protein